MTGKRAVNEGRGRRALPAESEEREGGHEALTMGGVPYGISISAEDADSAALRTFGYAGPVAVEDAPYIGSVQR